MLGPVFFNDRWVESAGLPLGDAGVVQGAIVVETIRTFGRQPFQLDWHRPRLAEALAYLGMDALPGGYDLAELVTGLLDRLPGTDDVAVVVLVTPQPTLIVHARPLPLAKYRRWQSEGVRLVVPSTPHATALPRTFKHRSRLHWWKADAQARAVDPDAMALLADTDGVLTETAIGNLVAIRDGSLVLADPARVVDGITLKAVRVLADRLAVPIVTADLTLDDLADCPEVWISSTGCCLAPVTRVDEHAFAIGPLYRRFVDAWHDEFGMTF